ncbi:TSUP family transporter [Microvirga antarctica]|uniref:TSUP family transporter n=1 Tax=Microvirga antarctica TaxID=2819233 RepID=UPI001B305579|nr:TSUP family transporter [Microvirga antarctica]
MGDLGFDTLAALAAISLLAGFVDAIAGGGGLLTVPALILAGLDPAQAIATNKVQGSVAAASATWTFWRKGMIDWKSAWRFTLMAFLSGIAGALCVRFLPRAVLDLLIPVLLIVIAIYFALSRKLQDADAAARMTALTFGLTAPVAIGFYDGIFGPGAGSFYMLAFVTLHGYGVVRATAHTKLLNFASNFGSLLLYAATGAVVWPLGLVMAGASLIGAQLGSRMALRFGVRIIRPLLVAVSSLMALRLLLDPANPWRRALATLF